MLPAVVACAAPRLRPARAREAAVRARARARGKGRRRARRRGSARGARERGGGGARARPQRARLLLLRPARARPATARASSGAPSGARGSRRPDHGRARGRARARAGGGADERGDRPQDPHGRGRSRTSARTRRRRASACSPRRPERAGVELVFDSGDGGDRRRPARRLHRARRRRRDAARAAQARRARASRCSRSTSGGSGFSRRSTATSCRAALELALGGQLRGRRSCRRSSPTAHSPERFAINEVSFQRRPELNIAHLSYSLAGEWVARVPCDGLIAATPAGSTAYSLSVGGPIVAWGVKGFVVNLIAPHALSSRALVAAPEDVLRVVNDGTRAGRHRDRRDADRRARPPARVRDQLHAGRRRASRSSRARASTAGSGRSSSSSPPSANLISSPAGRSQFEGEVRSRARARVVAGRRGDEHELVHAGGDGIRRPRAERSSSVPTSPTLAASSGGTCVEQLARVLPARAAPTSSPNPAALEHLAVALGCQVGNQPAGQLGARLGRRVHRSRDPRRQPRGLASRRRGLPPQVRCEPRGSSGVTRFSTIRSATSRRDADGRRRRTPRR